jgi:hypothetical protein
VNQVQHSALAIQCQSPARRFPALPALLVAALVLLAGLALSCGSLNNTVGEVQALDLCKCSPLEPDIADYRHAEKHVPIPAMTPVDVTISTILTWAQPDPGSIDAPRTGNELQVFHIPVAFVQEVSVNNTDCDIHLEISQTADKTAPRMIVETPVDSEYCSARKNIQTQLAQHGFTFDVEHGGELPKGLPADVVGLAFLDFDHNDVGLSRGSAQVATLWELHPAIVTLAP